MQSGRNISKDLFSHESSDFPPSLTKDGRMYHGTKREILDCIVPNSSETGKPQTTAAVLDGPVVIQSLRPVNSITIQEYIDNVIYPHLGNFLEVNDRVDVVFDVYKKSSIKSATREERGKGIRRRVKLTTKVPRNWASFLRVDLNKEELFVEIANPIKNMEIPIDKQVFITRKDECLSSADLDLSALAPSNHEEADTRIFVHVADAAKQGHRSIVVRTNDSDVVVIAVSVVV